MKFFDLASRLVKLEETASRNEMTQLLAELLKESDEGEVKKLVYLCLGNLGPSYARVQFNLAEKQIQKAIALAFGKELVEVKRKYKEIGDLGLVVEELAKSRKEGGLSVSQIYGELLLIANDEGMGSQERKIGQLARIFSESGSVSGKYVARIVMGRLRLGFSDKTVLDALSVMEAGDKSLKGVLEAAYQIRPDIGLLAEEVKKKGSQKAVEEVKAELGVPIMPMLCQRLKSAEEMVKKMGEVAVEAKLDGTRVQVHFKRGKKGFVRTFTRNLEENSLMFPELAGLGELVNADELILDGEAIGFDRKTGKLLPFQLTITRKRKHGVEAAAENVPLRFYIFDVMYKDGRSLIDLEYQERRKILEATIKRDGFLVVDEYWLTEDPEKIRLTHEKLLKEGFEGVVVKDVESKYVPGRTGWRWVKMKEVEEARAKLSDTLDLVVMGFYRGRGKRTGFGLGAFLVGTRRGEEIVTVAKIGTGLTDEQFREIKRRLDFLVSSEKPKGYVVDKNLEPDVWVEPELVVEIAADEITRSPIHSAGVALRFPRLIRFRDDKDVGGVTTLEEITSMM